jgi:hypothetical protein
VQRWDLDLLAARLAHDLIVHTDQVVAELGELGAVALVGARRQPILLHAPHPAHAVLIGAPAAVAGDLGRSGFRSIGKEGAFVEGHGG